jgi:hypothetical protein
VATQHPNDDRIGLFFFGASVLLALSISFRLGFPLDQIQFFIPIDDLQQMAWNLYWSTESLLGLKNPYLTLEATFPLPANLTQHSLAFGYVPFGLLAKLTVGDGNYAFRALNLAIALTFTVNFLATFGLLRMIGLGRSAASLGGLSFAFPNYIFFHLAHLNLIAFFLFPVTGMALLSLYRQRRFRNAVFTGVLLGGGIYFSEYALFLAIAVPFYGLALFLKKPPILSFKDLKLGGLTLVIALLIAAPFLIFFKAEPQVEKIALTLPGESLQYAGNLLGYVIPDPDENPVYSAWAPLRSRFSGMSGIESFLGYPLIALMVLALRAPKSCPPAIRAAWISGLLFWLLSLGEALHIGEATLHVPLPFSALKSVPPFEHFRTPVRFIVGTLFFFSVAAAFAVDQLERSLKSPAARFAWMSLLLGLLVLQGIEAQGHSYLGRKLAADFALPELNEGIKTLRGPVASFPTHLKNGRSNYLATFHGQAIADAYLARYTLEQREQIEWLEDRFIHGSPEEICQRLSQRGIPNLLMVADMTFIRLNQIKASSACKAIRILFPRSLDLKNASVHDLFFQGSTPGTAWDAPSNRIIQDSAHFSLNPPRVIRGIEFWGDQGDRYRIQLQKHHQVIREFSAGPSFIKTGIQEYFFAVDGLEPIDGITVIPEAGDAKFSIGRLSVIE